MSFEHEVGSAAHMQALTASQPTWSFELQGEEEVLQGLHFLSSLQPV